MKCKVCGLREPNNIIDVAAIQGIDLIGLIFYAKSPRFVDSKETAAAVSLCRKVKIVGVFVDESLAEIVRKCGLYHLNYIQLHGNETPDFIVALQKKIPSGIKVIKAFPIKSEEDLSATAGYEGLCEYFLFDTPTNGYGGSGRTFDWHILDYYSGLTPFLLSGGIGPDNIEALLNFRHKLWAGIDLNSQFETTPGLKNIPLLTNFIQQITSKPL